MPEVMHVARRQPLRRRTRHRSVRMSQQYSFAWQGTWHGRRLRELLHREVTAFAEM